MHQLEDETVDSGGGSVLGLEVSYVVWHAEYNVVMVMEMLVFW